MRTDARATSLKARVRNRAAALGLAPHVVLQNYMFERFLVRLAASPWRERLVLKGGLLVAHLHGLAERATMDMDATVQGFALTADSAVAAVAAVCAVDAGDGIAFSVASGEPIRRNDPYGGFRVHFDAAAFGIRVHLSVDLSTGDAVTPAPDAGQLAQIAVCTARTAKSVAGFADPRVAMLSFSTKGSAKHEVVDKVVEATALAKQLDPALKIDGELQADAALVPSVGAKKAPGSEIAGKANVLVVPNLEVGNISYKLIQRLGHAQAIGPILQGIAKPVNDLSRGCSVDDVYNLIAITACQAMDAK